MLIAPDASIPHDDGLARGARGNLIRASNVCFYVFFVYYCFLPPGLRKHPISSRARKNPILGLDSRQRSVIKSVKLSVWLKLVEGQ